MNKLMELERLVNTGGDEKRIAELRLELGSPVKKTVKLDGYRKPKKTGPMVKQIDKFSVDQYMEWKQLGLTDKEVSKKLDIGYSTLQDIKKQLGITFKSDIDTSYNTIKATVMGKLNNQRTIFTSVVKKFINETNEHVKRLERRHQNAAKESNAKIQSLQSTINRLEAENKKLKNNQQNLDIDRLEALMVNTSYEIDKVIDNTSMKDSNLVPLKNAKTNVDIAKEKFKKIRNNVKGDMVNNEKN